MPSKRSFTDSSAAEAEVDLASGSVVEIAHRLVGSNVVSSVDNLRVVLEITEVEAYGGSDDPASHAFRGPTARNASMYGPAGHLYVYRSYGIHWCANIVTGPEGSGQAVLLRAGRVIEGEEIAVARRGRRHPLVAGPGMLTQALGITGEHDGHDLTRPPVVWEPAPVPAKVAASPRIGISRAQDRLWRFVLAD